VVVVVAVTIQSLCKLYDISTSSVLSLLGDVTFSVPFDKHHVALSFSITDSYVEQIPATAM